MFRPTRTVAPALEPVTLAEAKATCRIEPTETDQDEVVSDLISAAVEYFDGLDGILGRAMINQTWQQPFRYFPGTRRMRLPFPDISSVTITYDDPDGVSQTLAASNWHLTEDHASTIVELDPDSDWPDIDDTPQPVRASFVTGFGAAPSNVPYPIRQAIRALVLEWYDHPGAVRIGTASKETEFGVSQMIAPYRRPTI